MLRKLSSIAMCFNLFMHAGQIGPLEEALRHHVKAHDAAVGCSELRPALGQAGTAKTGHEERAAIG